MAEESRFCVEKNCCQLAVWRYPSADGWQFCDLHVNRGFCSCQLIPLANLEEVYIEGEIFIKEDGVLRKSKEEDYSRAKDQQGRYLPCVDWMWIEPHMDE